MIDAIMIMKDYRCQTSRNGRDNTVIYLSVPIERRSQSLTYRCLGIESMIIFKTLLSNLSKNT
jgi:hypothetical protein